MSEGSRGTGGVQGDTAQPSLFFAGQAFRLTSDYCYLDRNAVQGKTRKPLSHREPTIFLVLCKTLAINLNPSNRWRVISLDAYIIGPFGSSFFSLGEHKKHRAGADL